MYMCVYNIHTYIPIYKHTYVHIYIYIYTHFFFSWGGGPLSLLGHAKKGLFADHGRLEAVAEVPQEGHSGLEMFGNWPLFVRACFLRFSLPQPSRPFLKRSPSSNLNTPLFPKRIATFKGWSAARFFGRRFNRSLVRTGVWRGFWNRPRTHKITERRRQFWKRTLLFSAPNSGMHQTLVQKNWILRDFWRF